MTLRVNQLETEVEASKGSLPPDKVKVYQDEMDGLRLRIKALEEAEREEAEGIDLERENTASEITRLKNELLDRQKLYDENVDAMDKKLKELTVDKQQLETELGIARRSQVS